MGDKKDLFVFYNDLSKKQKKNQKDYQVKLELQIIFDNDKDNDLFNIDMMKIAITNSLNQVVLYKLKNSK